MHFYGPVSLSVTIAQGGSAPAAWDASPACRLTRREREVLRLLCVRLTDAEIAARLSISPRTVNHHVGSILGKFGAANRREAAESARLLRLV